MPKNILESINEYCEYCGMLQEHSESHETYASYGLVCSCVPVYMSDSQDGYLDNFVDNGTLLTIY